MKQGSRSQKPGVRMKGSPAKRFQDLIVWQKAHQFVLLTYRYTAGFPKPEIYGLTSQFRRAAVSIPANIAEGFSRQFYKEKMQFYSVALGSVSELQNQLLVARDVGYLKKKEFKVSADQSVKVHKLINGLIKKSKTFIHNS